MIPKFRAWDVDLKTMYEVKSMVYTIKAVLGVNRAALYPERTLYWDTKNMVLMQSTGLFDRNGVEIFEGDFVRLKYQVYSDYETFKVVRFHGGAWRIDNRQRGTELWLRNEDCEVIGNIYENPELVED